MSFTVPAASAGRCCRRGEQRNRQDRAAVSPRRTRTAQRRRRGARGARRASARPRVRRRAARSAGRMRAAGRGELQERARRSTDRRDRAGGRRMASQLLQQLRARQAPPQPAPSSPEDEGRALGCAFIRGSVLGVVGARRQTARARRHRAFRTPSRAAPKSYTVSRYTTSRVRLPTLSIRPPTSAATTKLLRTLATCRSCAWRRRRRPRTRREYEAWRST